MPGEETEIEALLKRDALGRVERIRRGGRTLLRRVPCGGRMPGSRLLAGALARRERAALERLAGLDGVPSLVGGKDGEFLREHVEGERLDRAGAVPDDFFGRLSALLGKVHARGVAHNDLGKEANVLVRPDGSPSLVDFQLAVVFPPRLGPLARRLFGLLAREDLRHLLKHKRLRRPDLLTAEERERLALPSLPARAWGALGKPVYNFVTRRLLHTADREGEGPLVP